MPTASTVAARLVQSEAQIEGLAEATASVSAASSTSGATSAACGYPIAIAGSISFLLLGLGGDLPEGAVGYVHLPAFAGIAVASVVAAPLGAATVHRLAPNTVRRVFGVFLVLVGIRMLVGF